MDEPKKGDKNVGAKAWDAAIAKIEGNLDVETRQVKIWIRTAGILTNDSTRGVYDEQPQKRPYSPLNELTLKVDNNMVAGDMRLCARQIQRYYHAEGENPQKDCIKPADLARAAKLQPIFALEACEEGEIRWVEKWSREDGLDSVSNFCSASSWTSLRMVLDLLTMAVNEDGTQEEHSPVEEKANLVTHHSRPSRPSSPRSAPTVTIPQETNPWQDTGTDVAQSSEPLPHDRPEAPYHHAYARSWPPALEDQSIPSDHLDPIFELYQDSHPSPRRASAAQPWSLRHNQHGGAGRIPCPAGHSSSPHEQETQQQEDALLSFVSDEFKPFQSPRNGGQVLQTEHDVEELLTPENFAKYKRYRRREKRAGRA
ncbi:hypothetical protein FCIRC_1731 [Fusarium circinatum]|uniref:Uncharacterized protein n=1 Tax=Fusarium circinatum TaxID=48490 RepID=A0A8H5UGI7_FUSCI|nr:hypothetical protein FCIRC_1731 [Fusarium circinatum]